MSAPAPDYVIVIPARYDSVRLPGKVLLDIAGKPMLQHVWECAQASAARQVVVATDDARVAAAVRAFGGEAVMTRGDHPSGSDRIAECARLCRWPGQQIIVNLQGDEPQMPGRCLDQLARLLADDPQAAAASLYWPIAQARQVEDPNVVKVVLSGNGHALYFSRAAIPHARDHADIADAMAAGLSWNRHLGLYAYRNASLQAYTRLAPTLLEQTERLEQLRFLEHGLVLRMAQAIEPIPAGVDSAQDLERVRQSFAAGEPRPRGSV